MSTQTAAQVAADVRDAAALITECAYINAAGEWDNESEHEWAVRLEAHAALWPLAAAVLDAVVKRWDLLRAEPSPAVAAALIAAGDELSRAVAAYRDALAAPTGER